MGPVTTPSLHSLSIQEEDGSSIKSKPEAESAQHVEDRPTDEPTPEERLAEKRLVRRMDFAILVWCWCAYVMKQVDSSNYKTAYVSGMKEALNFQGNELNYLDTLFRIGYALFLIPSQIILTRIRPSIWLPSLECLWGLCTLLMAFVPSVKGMYVLRFFIGVFEASSFPGITCILCAWYTPRELALRLAIFGSSYPAAQIFVGFMQAALHQGMEGVGGLAGWKWLFIFNAIMTFVVALAGFFLIPDAPGSTRAFWLTPAQNALAKARMTRSNKLAQTPFQLGTVKRVFTSPLPYLFGIAYMTLGESQNSNTWISLMLKAERTSTGAKRFGITQLNVIPIPGYVLQMLAMFAFAWASGRFGGRYIWIMIQLGTLVVGNIILSAWPAAFEVRMLAYCILWCNHAAGAILTAWMADLCPDPSERAVVLGVAITANYVIDAFANILIYPAKKAPNYPIGYKAALAFALTSMIFCTAMVWWERKSAAARCQCTHDALCRQKEREEAEQREGEVRDGCCKTAA